MSTWIIYGLVIVFFLVLPIIVLIATREPRRDTQPSQGHASLTYIDKISYIIIVAIFALMIALTLLIHREHS